MVPLHYLKYSSFYSTKNDIKDFLQLVRPFKTNFDLIRIGEDDDGSYLIPNDLDGIKYCFSPGVGITSAFENHLTTFGIKCFLADYSVDSAPTENNLFEFDKKFIGDKKNNNFITLKEWVNSKKLDNNNLLLQMDIEGHEYKIFNNIEKELLLKFRIIVIEFHYLKTLNDKYGLKFIKNVFQKVLNHFTIIHIHTTSFEEKTLYKNFEFSQNMEITFLRNERIKNKSINKNFPHPLDRLNGKGKPDYILPKCCYE